MEETSKKVRQREIKFRRAYFHYSDDSFAGFSFWGSNYDENGIPTGFTAPSSWSNAKGKVDQQVTGLKDKAGKEIYEGDIVRWHSTFRGASQKEHVDKIEWQDTHACFLLMPYVHEPHAAEMEVIGNIFEHPHLLSQGEIKTELI